MNNILRISEAATIAIHTMYFLSKSTNKLVSAKEIANIFSLSENHLAKVMQRLVKANLVESVRGPKGGFRISKGKEDTSLLEIYESIDGKLNFDICLFNKRICKGNCCLLGDFLCRFSSDLKKILEERKLSRIDSCLFDQIMPDPY